MSLFGGHPRTYPAAPAREEVVLEDDLVELAPAIPLAALEECATQCGVDLCQYDGVTFAIVKRASPDRPAKQAQLRAWGREQIARSRFPERLPRPDAARNDSPASPVGPIFPREGVQ